MKPLTNKEIENLVNNEKVTNAAIKNAIEAFKAEEAEKQGKLIIGQLREIQRIVDTAVANLRRAREQEKKAKAKLTKLANAQQQFLADADVNAFNKVAFQAQFE